MRSCSLFMPHHSLPAVCCLLLKLGPSCCNHSLCRCLWPPHCSQASVVGGVPSRGSTASPVQRQLYGVIVFIWCWAGLGLLLSGICSVRPPLCPVDCRWQASPISPWCSCVTSCIGTHTGVLKGQARAPANPGRSLAIVFMSLELVSEPSGACFMCYPRF